MNRLGYTMTKARLFMLNGIGAAVIATVAPVEATTSTVTATRDSGAGTLRQTILEANTSSEPALIQFNLPGSGVRKIRPTSPLPTITNRVTLDGYSQAGSHPNTLVQGDDAVILVEIDGTGLVSSGIGLRFGRGSGGSVLRGLAVAGFPSIHVAFDAGSDGCLVQGNFIGLDATGATAPKNFATGIHFDSSFSHQVGGPLPADRNIISGQQGNGLFVFGAPNPLVTPAPIQIQGNYFGTDRTGTKPIPNTGDGIVLSAPLARVGGTAPGEGNLIAFNRKAGVDTYPRGKSVAVLGNSIHDNAGGGIVYFDDIPHRPIITSGPAGSSTVGGTLIAVPNGRYRFEIFGNAVCDGTGFGQGETLLGAAESTLDNAGSGTFNVQLPMPLVTGQVLTATATPLNVPDGFTLGFSPCFPVIRQLRLAISRGPADHVIVAWPSEAAGYTLEHNLVSGGGSSWQALPLVTAPLAGAGQIEFPASGATDFFRLRQ